MTAVLGACGIALSAAILALLLSEIGYHGGRLIGISATVLILIVAIGRISDILSLFNPLLSGEEIKEPIRLGLKVVGVGYTVGVCRDMVEEMGHKSLAGALMTLGRVEILLIVAPKIIEVVRLAMSLI